MLNGYIRVGNLMKIKFTEKELLLIVRCLIYTHNFDEILSQTKKEEILKIQFKIDNAIHCFSKSE